MFHTVHQTIFSLKFKQIFDIYTRRSCITIFHFGLQNPFVSRTKKISFILKHDEKMVIISSSVFS